MARCAHVARNSGGNYIRYSSTYLLRNQIFILPQISRFKMLVCTFNYYGMIAKDPRGMPQPYTIGPSSYSTAT